MNIGRQWEERLAIWAQQFPKYYVKPCGKLEMSYFTTMEHLSFDEAQKGAYVPAPAGTKWGKKWEYAWFRTSFTVPKELDGKRIVFTLNTAEEMLVWVNGVERGAIDKQHRYITVTRCAEAGTVYEITAECYAGHGPRQEGAGPCGYDEITVAEPAPQQVTTGESFFAVWNEDLFQVAMDYLTLFQLVQKLPPKSLRTMKIIEGLKKFTYIADFELPEPELTQSVVEAGKVLKPLLECKNGSTVPDYTVFGQSHLDMAWLWPVEETMRKTARTYSNQLELMDEYEEYRFLLCEPPIMEFLKELYPNVHARVMEKVKEGTFYPDGALWIESDTNIPTGESLIRQFVRGKRWFRNELGVDSKMAWMPDTFGFSAVLPQIMSKCQVPYFSTQKLTRQDPEAETFPYNLFWWEGMDGSRVLSHLHKKNNARFNAGDLLIRWEEDRVQEENIYGFMYPFGFGDGGGGPTREMVEIARRCVDLEGAPRCHMEAPSRFFERSLEHDIPNTYKGELYLAWHRGTLTTQARTKRGIRKAEVMLKIVEYHLAQRMLNQLPIDPAWEKKLEELWKLLLFNQFHDVAPGTSIRRVHERAEAELWQVSNECEELLRAMLGSSEEGVMVYNHLGWDRKYHGNVIPAQGCVRVGKTDGRVAANCETPAVCTWNTKEDCYELRNAHLVCRINAQGELTSVRRVGDTREYLAGNGNCFAMYKDVNTCYDAWELGSMYRNLPVELSGAAKLSLCEEENGVALLLERTLHHSTLSQKIFLGHDAKRIDFITEIDWQERHKMLKVTFPVNVYTTEAVHEIQFGYVKRPNHNSKQSDRDKYEVCNHRYTALCDGAMGAAVLNDCKYGVSADEQEIALTLLKSPLMPDMYADRGHQEFTYAFYPFDGALSESDVVREAQELNEPLWLGEIMEEPVYAQDYICLSKNKNIIVDTVKPADTRANTILVRVYEAMGQATESELVISDLIASAEETDMLEENGHEVRISEEGTLQLHFGAFEIKTLLLKIK